MKNFIQRNAPDRMENIPYSAAPKKAVSPIAVSSVFSFQVYRKNSSSKIDINIGEAIKSVSVCTLITPTKTTK
jgi:hypothetical protein